MRRKSPLIISRDEATTMPKWSTGHWLLLNDRDTELLADGVMPATLPTRCASLLSYRRDQEQEDRSARRTTFRRKETRRG